ncbi:hypothetical protein CJJ23_03090 [Mycoplasmopsis agassizii]|uniref:Uncharacterized protein n=1 Tax=Mycoplasmopsis agassizii TaxID=33922 RepID=A0A269TJM7_9BACT|nr:hypothetical protein [Mycoplasmopsis agassizii]PAK21236.1 hypothetical protein CJJ23_03090 [Mycoplasmopsis agassizii]
MKNFPIIYILLLLTSVILILVVVLVLYLFSKKRKFAKRATYFLKSNNLITRNFNFQDFAKITKKSKLLASSFFIIYASICSILDVVSIAVSIPTDRHYLDSNEIAVMFITGISLILIFSTSISISNTNRKINKYLRTNLVSKNSKIIYPIIKKLEDINKEEFLRKNIASFFQVYSRGYWLNFGIHIKNYHNYINKNWSNDEAKRLELVNFLFLAIIMNNNSYNSPTSMYYDEFHEYVFMLVYFKIRLDSAKPSSSGSSGLSPSAVSGLDLLSSAADFFL